MKRPILAAALLLALLPSAPQLNAAACVPTAASICMGADDEAEVWVNGTPLGFVFPYVDKSSASPVPCFSVPVGLLNAGGPNYLAVRLRNTAPSVTMACWVMDIECSSGEHSYLSSDDAFEFYEDLDNNNPPPILGGLNWYDPAYVPAPAWGAPTTVTGAFWVKQPIHPYTGQPMAPKSWTANADGASTGGYLYFRQGFVVVPQPTFTPSPTPVPPSFDACIAPASCAFDNDGTNVVFNFMVINSGGTAPLPLQVVFTRPSSPTGVSFSGPYSDPNWSYTSVGQTDTFVYNNFPASTTLNYYTNEVIYYTPPANYGTWETVTAQVIYNGAPVKSFSFVMGVHVAGACTPYPACTPPANTATFTPSPSPSMTATFTASNTPNGSSTATPTFTDSPTPSPSRTATQTYTASPSSTTTGTPTLTATLAPTNTPLPTNTPTPPPLILKGLPSSPNPADDKGVWIAYELSVDANVDIGLYTVAGERVRTLDPFPGKAGANEQFWDLINNAGSKVASGVFIYQIIATAASGEQQKVMAKLSVAR